MNGVKKINRAMLLEMPYEKPVCFPLESAKDAETARSMASQAGKLTGDRWSVTTSYNLGVVTVIRRRRDED